MLKPARGAQGKGISLHADLASLAAAAGRSPTLGGMCAEQADPAQSSWVVQEYIEPLLVNAVKFDQPSARLSFY